MNLYENLTYLRKINNLTQEQLANKLGVTRQTVSKWEMGLSDPSLDILDKIADIYNCSVDELLGRNCKDITAEKSDCKAKQHATEQYKEPFWNLYKQAFLVIFVGVILTLIYYLCARYSETYLSILVFIAIECPIYIVSAIVAIIGDTRIKTLGGVLDLVLPIIIVIICQTIIGVVVEL